MRDSPVKNETYANLGKIEIIKRQLIQISKRNETFCYSSKSSVTSYTVVTRNKGQSIFDKIGSNKGLFGRNQTKMAVYDFSMPYLGLINPNYHLLGGLEFE